MFKHLLFREEQPPRLHVKQGTHLICIMRFNSCSSEPVVTSFYNMHKTDATLALLHKSDACCVCVTRCVYVCQLPVYVCAYLCACLYVFGCVCVHACHYVYVCAFLRKVLFVLSLGMSHAESYPPYPIREEKRSSVTECAQSAALITMALVLYFS